MSRQAIHQQLQSLLPAQIEAVMFQYGMPKTYVRQGVTLEQQILDLIQYAEQQDAGLDKLSTITEKGRDDDERQHEVCVDAI